MGAKFSSIHIRDVSPDILQKLLLSYKVKTISEGWTTILREDFEIGKVDQEARRLSKKIDSAVLAVGYYDDDILVLSIYRNGKNITSHVSSDAYGYTAKMGKVDAFVNELKLDNDDGELLKWIFKCEDLGRKVELLSVLFGIPLWIDSYTLKELGEEDFKYSCDKSTVVEYMREAKADSKIKNYTKLKLIYEKEGMLNQVLDSTLYNVILPSAEKDYILDDSCIFVPGPDGALLPFLKNNSIGFEGDEYSGFINEHKKVILSNSIKVNGKKIEERRLYSFNNNGELTDSYIVHEKDIYPIRLLPDGDIIYSSYGPNQIIYDYDANGDKRWKLEVGYLHVSPIIHGEYIYLQREKSYNEKTEIVKINRSGNIEASFETKTLGECHWDKFFFDKFGRMFYCYSIDDNDCRITKLVCFNNKLEILKEIELSDTSFDAVMDNKGENLFITIFEKELIKIDIAKMEICVQKKFNEELSLVCVNQRGNLIIQKGASTVELYTDNLEILSHHRLKGGILDYFTNTAGNLCIVTCNRSAWDAGKEKSMIRVYEIS